MSTVVKLYIYGLIDPRTNLVRYVGKTNNLERRLKQHLKDSSLKFKTHKNFWIKSLLNLNLIPEIELLEEVFEDNWKDREKHWISFFGRDALTNSNDGGIGGENPSVETRIKIGLARKGRKFSLQTREKISKSKFGELNPFYGKKHTKEAIEKMRLASVGNYHNKGFKNRFGLAKKNKPHCTYIGVTFNDTYRNKYIVKTTVNGSSVHIGYFYTEIEAALAYNEFAQETYGWKARLNVISEEELQSIWKEEIDDNS